LVCDQKIYESGKLAAVLEEYDGCRVFYIDNFDKVSTLKNGEGVLGVFQIPKQKSLQEFITDKKKIISLFEINDPGNLGTIVRTAVWFEVDGVILCGNCVDLYSPKVVRSCMGSLFKIDIINIDSFRENLSFFSSYKRVGTFLDIESNFQPDLNKDEKLLLMLGNEANGLDDSLKECIDANYVIKSSSSFESLNLSVAAGIVMYEIMK